MTPLTSATAPALATATIVAISSGSAGSDSTAGRVSRVAASEAMSGLHHACRARGRVAELEMSRRVPMRITATIERQIRTAFQHRIGPFLEMTSTGCGTAAGVRRGVRARHGPTPESAAPQAVRHALAGSFEARRGRGFIAAAKVADRGFQTDRFDFRLHLAVDRARVGGHFMARFSRPITSASAPPRRCCCRSSTQPPPTGKTPYSQPTAFRSAQRFPLAEKHSHETIAGTRSDASAEYEPTRLGRMRKLNERMPVERVAVSGDPCGGDWICFRYEATPFHLLSRDESNRQCDRQQDLQLRV